MTLDAVESVLPATITYGVVRTTPAGTCETYPNTATLSTDNGTVEKADASVTICVGKDLTAEKTATAGYNRTYALSLIHI